jgi:hypothetical protein
MKNPTWNLINSFRMVLVDDFFWRIVDDLIDDGKAYMISRKRSLAPVCVNFL